MMNLLKSVGETLLIAADMMSEGTRGTTKEKAMTDSIKQLTGEWCDAKVERNGRW